MGKADLLRQLREQTGSILPPSKAFWKAPGLQPGVAQGIVAELLGNARTEWLLEIMAHHPDPFVFWVEREIKVNPTAIHQRGVALHRIKFVQSPGDLQQPLRMALESRHYGFVVAPNRFHEVRHFQRFHLLAEKSKSTLFLFGEETFSSAWPISLQLAINFSDDGYDIQIQRQKHGSFP